MNAEIDSASKQAVVTAKNRRLGPPILHSDGWSRAEALLLRSLVNAGQVDAAVGILASLGVDDARAILIQADFRPSLFGDRESVFGGLKFDFLKAAEQSLGPVTATVTTELPTAMNTLQTVFSAGDVEVGLAGTAPLETRTSMQFLAGQAIMHRVTGFEIDGIDGKYKLPSSIALRDVKNLFVYAAGELAMAEVRSTIPGWANGKPAAKFSDLVPESIARILRGSPSLSGIASVQAALVSGMVKDFASKQGSQIIGQVFDNRGVKLDMPSAQQLAEDAGLKITIPDQQRGNYFGTVVAIDHRSSVIKWSRDSVLIFPHKELPDGVARPSKGDVVRIKYSGGNVGVIIQSQPRIKETIGGR